MVYVDTSVLAAYYCTEPLSAAAQTAIRAAHEPVISLLVEVEFAAAVALKVRTGELTAVTGREVLAVFRQHLRDGRFRVMAIESRNYEQAREWLSLFAVPLRTLDALHLATALANGLTLLTADKTLAQYAKRFGADCKLVG